MRGNSPEEVAALLMAQPGLQGLQGPTISPVYGPGVWQRACCVDLHARSTWLCCGTL